MYVVSGTVGPLGSFGSDEAVADHAAGSNGKVVNMGIFLLTISKSPINPGS